jgi:diguanylate cyclase (GGDEF)-like protein
MGERFTTKIQGRVSRRAVALNPAAWLSVGACFIAFAVAAITIAIAIPPFQRLSVALTGVGLGAIALFLLSRPAPDADSPVTHIAVAAVYVSTAGAMLAFAPQGSAPLPAVTFMGVVAAVWLDSNRQVLAHYLAATLVLMLPSAVGITDLTTLLATMVLLPSSFVLGACARNVLNLAEKQGLQLEELAMRDPLTGTGNRRLLDEQLHLELARHAATRRPLTVFALDLNGFKTINDTLGHAAGDRVLRDVGARLMALAGDRATVSRLGGDEFMVMSPATGRRDAERIAEELRTGLGPSISTGIGWATYPFDGEDPDALLELADARLIARKSEQRPRTGAADVQWVHDLVLPDDQEPSPLHHAARRTFPPISRELLGSSTVLWRVTGVMFLFYAAAACAFRVAGAPQLASGSTPYLMATGLLVGVAVLLSPAPALHTWRSELVLALTYIVPAAATLSTAPHGSAVIGFGIFVGPLVAVRTRTRRRAAMHLGASLLISAGVAASGMVDTATILALAMLALTEVVLAFYCVVVLEACEAQGAELERLSAVDPLTLLANRRRLNRELALIVASAEAQHGQVALLALDLNGFKHLNDTVGHAAGDVLLIDVADRLRELSGPDALTARPGGDEFVVVLAGRCLSAATEVADRLRDAIGALRPSGCPISTGIGIALFPSDGRTPDELLAAADRRLIADKYGHEPAPTPAAAA